MTILSLTQPNVIPNQFIMQIAEQKDILKHFGNPPNIRAF